MFLGEYHNRVDAKGRLMVPSRFRTALGEESAMIKPGLDGCLILLSLSTWEQQAQLIRDSLPPTTADGRFLRRKLLAGAEPCSLDAFGRALLPPLLRGRAGIRKEAVVLGMVDYAEIWSRERWSEYLAPGETRGEIEEILERVSASLPPESLRFL